MLKGSDKRVLLSIPRRHITQLIRPLLKTSSSVVHIPRTRYVSPSNSGIRKTIFADRTTDLAEVTHLHALIPTTVFARYPMLQ